MAPGLVEATKSTDTEAPTTAISSPADGARLDPNTDVTITGTAADVGGRVGAVEVSTDGGTTWHPATGRESWTYAWTTPEDGDVTIKARAADDSGNRQASAAAITVTVG